MGSMDSRRVAERVPDADPPSLVVRGVTPAVDAGRYAVKRLVGDELRVGADIFKDGHDALAARLSGASVQDSVRKAHLLASRVIQYPGAVIAREAMVDLMP